MTAVWESDMLDIFLRFRLNWSTDQTWGGGGGGGGYVQKCT